MKNTSIYSRFNEHRLSERQSMVYLRTKKFTQQQIADKTGVSLRTIQNFEAGRSDNYYLIFVYNEILHL